MKIQYKNMDKKIVAIVIFVLGAILGGTSFYLFQSEKALSSAEAGEIAVNFINNNIEEGLTASLLDISQFGDIYKIRLKIAETEYESFITKDGRFLFPTGINLEEQSGEAVPEDSSQAPGQEALASFAKCLTDKGAKFYGASWCGHCKNQKEMFGQASEFLPYVECSAPDGKSQTAICKENNITSYPTWVFADGTSQSGELSLQTLTEKTGCQLPQ